MIIAAEYALIAFVAAAGAASLRYFRTAALRARSEPPRSHRRRGLIIIAVSFVTALGLLLLFAMALAWALRDLNFSAPTRTGLVYGITFASAWTLPVLAAALLRWTIATPQNAEIASVRLPLAYWVIEYSIVTIGCAMIGSLSASLRAENVVFFALPFGLVVPQVLRAVAGPRILRRRMRSWIERVGKSSSPADVSALQEWVNDTAPHYRLASAPRVIAVKGARSLAVYAVPADAAIILGEDDLASMSQPERQALTAHELAHVVRNEGLRRIAVETLISVWYIGLFAWWLMKHPTASIGLRYLWFFAYGYGMQAVRTRLRRRSEFAADRLAVKMLGDAAPLIAALRKLALRKGNQRATRTHPQIAARIAALEERA